MLTKKPMRQIDDDTGRESSLTRSQQQALMKSVLSQMTDDERIALKQSFAGDKQAAGGGK